MSNKHNIFGLVSDHFGGDNEKTYAWFINVHPYFGVAPVELMRKGQHSKLLKYIVMHLEQRDI